MMPQRKVVSEENRGKIRSKGDVQSNVMVFDKGKKEGSNLLIQPISKKGLTFNGLLRSLEKDRDKIMRVLLGVILEALENQAAATFQEVSPARFIRNGRQPNLCKFQTCFGELNISSSPEGLIEMSSVEGAIERYP